MHALLQAKRIWATSWTIPVVMLPFRAGCEAGLNIYICMWRSPGTPQLLMKSCQTPLIPHSNSNPQELHEAGRM